MKTKSIKSYVAVAMLAVVGLNSCKKETIDPINVKNQAKTEQVQVMAEDQSYMNLLVYKTVMMTFGATSGNINSFKNESTDELLSGCATVTKDTTVFPHTLLIEFSSGCTLNDGSLVSGFITASFSNKNFGITPGSTATIDFDSFYINNNHILGQLEIENTGANVNGNSEFSLIMSGASLIYGSDGRQIRQNSDWVLEWVTYGTPVKDDDMFSFTGTSDGVSSNGDAFTDQITVPLIISRDPACVRQFISGTTVAQIANNPDLTIDYGTGACDTEATATQNGSPVRIQLANY